VQNEAATPYFSKIKNMRPVEISGNTILRVKIGNFYIIFDHIRGFSVEISEVLPVEISDDFFFLLISTKSIPSQRTLIHCHIFSKILLLSHGPQKACKICLNSAIIPKKARYPRVFIIFTTFFFPVKTEIEDFILVEISTGNTSEISTSTIPKM